MNRSSENLVPTNISLYTVCPGLGYIKGTVPYGSVRVRVCLLGLYIEYLLVMIKDNKGYSWGKGWKH